MPRHISVIFPGQGSQFLGMLNSFNHEEINQIKPFIDKTIDVDIIDIINNGPEDILNKTSITQPSILLTSYFYFKKFVNETNIKPDLLAGHSLGEYSALLAANSINIEDAISLVHNRGLYMENSKLGSMYAILNLDLELINSICEDVRSSTGNIVSAANINSPNQVVISGETEAAKIVAEKCKENGAKRCIQLKVSVASHCELMAGAANKFSNDLVKCEIKIPEIPILHNVNADVENNISNIPNKLIEQLTKPVQWVETMNHIKKYDGIVIECGPGKVLSGLAKTNGIDNILSMCSDNFYEELQNLL